MIEILEFDRRPVQTGEMRRLVLGGDGPFELSDSCFVDEPRPPGFRPCAECSTRRVDAYEPYDLIVSPTFWRGKQGYILLNIGNAIGESLELRIDVLPDVDSAPMAGGTAIAG